MFFLSFKRYCYSLFSNVALHNFKMKKKVYNQLPSAGINTHIEICILNNSGRTIEQYKGLNPGIQQFSAWTNPGH